MGLLQFGLRDMLYWALIAAQATTLYMVTGELEITRRAAEELVVPPAINRKTEFDHRQPEITADPQNQLAPNHPSAAAAAGAKEILEVRCSD